MNEYSFRVYQLQAEKEIVWVAECLELDGCIGQGETPDEAITEMRSNQKEWIETAKECGIKIPEPHHVAGNEYSGKMTLRMSTRVHEEAAAFAKNEKISLNQYVNDAIVAKNAENKKQNNFLITGYDLSFLRCGVETKVKTMTSGSTSIEEHRMDRITIGKPTFQAQ